MITPNRIGLAVAMVYLAGAQAFELFADDGYGAGYRAGRPSARVAWIETRLTESGVIAALLAANAALMYGIGFGAGRLFMRAAAR